MKSSTAACLDARAQLAEVSTLVRHREPTHVLATLVDRDIAADVASAIKAMLVVERQGLIRLVRDLQNAHKFQTA